MSVIYTKSKPCPICRKRTFYSSSGKCTTCGRKDKSWP